jgi:hypothetical protein
LNSTKKLEDCFETEDQTLLFQGTEKDDNHGLEEAVLEESNRKTTANSKLTTIQIELNDQ